MVPSQRRSRIASPRDEARCTERGVYDHATRLEESQHWGEVHGPLFAAQSESKQYVRRYIQDHRTNDALPGTTASNFDGIAEIWFDDISGAKAFFESDGYRQNVIPDEEAFMDRKRCELLYTHEHSVMP